MKSLKRKDSCTFKREISLDNQERIYTLRHQNVADNSESQLDAQVAERGDEVALESIGVEEAGAAIGARRQVMKVI